MGGGAEPFLLSSGSRFLTATAPGKNIGSGSTYIISAPTGSGSEKQILIQNIKKAKKASINLDFVQKWEKIRKNRFT